MLGAAAPLYHLRRCSKHTEMCLAQLPPRCSKRINSTAQRHGCSFSVTHPSAIHWSPQPLMSRRDHVRDTGRNAIHKSPQPLMSCRGPVSESGLVQCHGCGLRVANPSTSNVIRRSPRPLMPRQGLVRDSGLAQCHGCGLRVTNPSMDYAIHVFWSVLCWHGLRPHPYGLWPPFTLGLAGTSNPISIQGVAGLYVLVAAAYWLSPLQRTTLSHPGVGRGLTLSDKCTHTTPNPVSRQGATWFCITRKTISV